jgi:hypothetical protein
MCAPVSRCACQSVYLMPQSLLQSVALACLTVLAFGFGVGCRFVFVSLVCSNWIALKQVCVAAWIVSVCCGQLCGSGKSQKVLWERHIVNRLVDTLPSDFGRLPWGTQWRPSPTRNKYSDLCRKLCPKSPPCLQQLRNTRFFPVPCIRWQRVS